MKKIIDSANISKTEKEIAKKFSPEILWNGATFRPIYVTGRGKWTRNYESREVLSQIELLEKTNLFYVEKGNDAPRGGRTGEYVKFTPKKKRLGLKQKVEAKYLEIETERLKQKAIEDHNNFIREEKERIYLEQQESIINEKLNDPESVKYLVSKIEKAKGNRHQRYQTGCWKAACKWGVSSSLVKSMAKEYR